MHISNTTLIRKLHALVNLSPTAYLRQVRLKKAHQLLHTGAGSISEIGYQVGFNSLSYFSRCYREYFGILPSQEMRKKAELF
jgi:AraC-like DNA-binding protein